MQIAPILRGAFNWALPAATSVYSHVFTGPERLGAPLADPPAGSSARAPQRPVVLVAGFGNDGHFMDVWQRSLRSDGFRAFSFADPQHCLGDLKLAAERLTRFVDGVRAQTGSDQVDIVAYSAGITTTRAYLSLDGGGSKVHTLVDLDGSWSGDDDSRFLSRLASVPVIGSTLSQALPIAELQLQRSSPLYAELHAHPEIPAGLAVTSIYAAQARLADEVPGATNVVLTEESGHLAMARSSNTAYTAARAALLELAISPRDAGIASNTS